MEDNYLIAGLEDKFYQCEEKYMVTSTNFLDMRQRASAEKLCANLCKNHKEVAYVFYGGYEDAERTVAMFLPDYSSLEEGNPLAAIRITKCAGGRELSHGDYLGSLMALGIKREVIGDILVNEDGADLIVLKEIQEYLLLNYEKAGKISLDAKPIPIENICIPRVKIEEREETVASLRLDNVIASAFSLSRSKAVNAIKGGMVFVNNMQAEKPDVQLKEGDKLVCRGRGKTVLKEVGGRTRKGRVFIVMDRYR